MKGISLITMLLCFSVNVNAQSYAIIKDDDGYTNVRKQGSSKSTVIGKIYNNDIFVYNVGSNSPTVRKPDWVKIYQIRANHIHLEGYIHKRKILPLSSFKSIAASKHGDHFAIIKNDSLIIKITEANFIAKNHKLTYINPSTSATFYDKIDGKKIWGTDGALPKRAITALSIIINGNALSIPKAATNDLFEPNFNTLRVYFGLNNTLYIQMNNSDGAGSYTVIWIVKDGKYQTRYLDNLEYI